MDCFLPLGGANEVGASSYYLKLGQTNILLDCGARIHESIIFPNYNKLLEQQLDDFGQLDVIVISHAHYDHIGSLYSIASVATNATIYATKITKELMRLQLIDFERTSHFQENERIRKLKLMRTEEIINRIVEVPMISPVQHGDCKITLYPAGHMAGACMVGLETETHKVLYTGDFSFNSILQMNELTTAGFHPDTLILNATYGYKYGDAKGFDYKRLEYKIHHYLKHGHNVLLKSNSIAKHLDLFYALKIMKPGISCYLHHSSEPIAEAFSKLHYDVYSDKIRMDKQDKPTPHILIAEYDLPGYYVISVDKYSLHASFPELLNMIYMCMPKRVFVVHTFIRENCLNFMDDLENQGRYQGIITQCMNEMTYPI